LARLSLVGLVLANLVLALLVLDNRALLAVIMALE
jgi:hypothetical protein